MLGLVLLSRQAGCLLSDLRYMRNRRAEVYPVDRLAYLLRPLR